jgi:hypothetical protein
MKISTFLFGMLCLTPAAPAVAGVLGGRLGSGIRNKSPARHEKGDEQQPPLDEASDSLVEGTDPQLATDIVDEVDVKPVDEASDGSRVEGTDPESTTDIVYESPIDDESTTTHPSKGAGYGYSEAKMLWTSQDFACESIPSEYWVHVQKVVFSNCDAVWAEASTTDKEAYVNLQDCKSAAHAFTVNMMNECFTDEMCITAGSSAAAMAVGMYCETDAVEDEQQRYPTAASWIPAKCSEYAMKSCSGDASARVSKSVEGGLCSKGSAAYDFDMSSLDVLCEKLLNEMQSGAELPYEY